MAIKPELQKRLQELAHDFYHWSDFIDFVSNQKEFEGVSFDELFHAAQAGWDAEVLAERAAK